MTAPARKTVEAAPAAAPARKIDKDLPLIQDIRLLGRILGDVIREQEGVAAYEVVEQVRKLSVAFRRDADQEADRALKKLLKSLTGGLGIAGRRPADLHAPRPPARKKHR